PMTSNLPIFQFKDPSLSYNSSAAVESSHSKVGVGCAKRWLISLKSLRALSRASILPRTPPIFVGVSLNDPELLLLLGYIHNIFHGGSPNHYALVSKDSVTTTEVERWRKDFNIQIITYDSQNNHVELKKYLEQIIEETGEANFDD
ncbi:MAG: SIR2 family protein, partial [Flavobacterium sp.]|nr:SIR2 family protein [Flavobacterium sp.]